MATTQDIHAPTLGAQGEPCAGCGAPLAGDQRYCLECGARRSQARVAQLRKEQGLLELKAIEVELSSAVSSLVRKVTATQQKSQSFQEVVALNQRLLDTDLTRLDSGKTDSRKLLQTEQDLADARANELEARIEWQRSVVELLVQTGTYLSKRGHEIQ